MVAAPPAGPTWSRQVDGASVFQTTVIDVLVRSWRYGPRVSV
jgi:hypothetical protein